MLGILDVRLSMAQVDAALATSERQMQYGLFATGLAVLLLSFVLLWALVLRPVKRLRSAMERAGTATSGARSRAVQRRDGRARPLLEPHDQRLQRARGELEGLNRTLEQRVLEKTRELEHTHHQMVVVEKMASLGKLAAVVAHEINNPLAGIQTYARLLRRQFAAGPRAPERPSRRRDRPPADGGRRGRPLRRHRAQPAGLQPPVRRRLAEVDLGPIVERCRMLLKHQAEMLDVTLEARATLDLPRIVCDAAQMQQVILALALNALEATPADGRVSIDVASGTATASSST